MKLLIVSTSVGSGHVRAAAALEETARELHPDVQVKHVDMMQYVSPIYRALYAGTYLPLTNRTPQFWGYLYKRTDVARAARRQAKIIRAYDALQFRHFRAMVAEYAPDVMIATHFLPLQVYEPLRTEGKISWPLVVVLTDFDAHVLWAQFTGDRFFVPSDEVADVLADKGIERGKISTAGIPILPAFGRDYDRAAIRADLGLREGLPTLLVMGGAFGQGGLTDTVAMALQTACVQVLAVAGKNEKARHELETLKPPAGSTLRVFGYVNNIPELMAASDLVISKSGGLTLAECLAMGLPMLVPDPVPGQEERNCKYAIECGAAMCGDTRHSLRYKLKLMLETPGLLARMAAAARAHGRPNAARDILRSALEMAGAPHTFTRTPGVNTGTLKVS